MSKTKVIGFRSYDSEEREKEKEEEKKHSAVADFLSLHYAPIGPTSEKCYKTMAELAYELSNIVDVSPRELAAQLTAAGYRVEYLAEQPYLVMYEKQ